jgi:hypothetical protein
MLRRTASSVNNAEIPGHFVGRICGGNLILPTGHGGEGKEFPSASRSSSKKWCARRLCAPVSGHDTGRASAIATIKPSWRRCVVGDAAGEAFFSLNKWHGFLLCICQILLLLLSSPPAYRGGVERGLAPVLICRDGEGKGESIPEHIHAAGCCAAAIFSRQGGMSSTSSMEALLRHCHGCSNPICREVICSPRRSGGPCGGC